MNVRLMTINMWRRINSHIVYNFVLVTNVRVIRKISDIVISYTAYIFLITLCFSYRRSRVLQKLLKIIYYMNSLIQYAIFKINFVLVKDVRVINTNHHSWYHIHNWPGLVQFYIIL